MQIFTSEHISQQCNLFSVTETDAVYRNIDLTNFLYYNSYMSTDFVVLLLYSVEKATEILREINFQLVQNSLRLITNRIRVAEKV